MYVCYIISYTFLCFNYFIRKRILFFLILRLGEGCGRLDDRPRCVKHLRFLGERDSEWIGRNTAVGWPGST